MVVWLYFFKQEREYEWVGRLVGSEVGAQEVRIKWASVVMTKGG